MAFFRNHEETESLRKQVIDITMIRKKLAAALSDERKRSAEMSTQIDAMRIEIDKLKNALLKAKQRQKSSVDRANRFKSTLHKMQQC